MVLYVETNFLLSYATGRNLGSDRILGERPPGVDLVIPSVCFMEAFSVLEDERKRQNRLINEFTSQINQSRRNLISPRIESMTEHLRESIVEYEAIFEDFTSRLTRAIDVLGSTAELIHPALEIIAGSLANTLIDDPTDNLILASVLRHASLTDPRDQAFLSENTRDFARDSIARSAWQGAGVVYFAGAAKYLEWHGSRAES